MSGPTTSARRAWARLSIGRPRHAYTVGIWQTGAWGSGLEDAYGIRKRVWRTPATTDAGLNGRSKR